MEYNREVFISDGLLTLITRPSENISQPAAPRTAGHFKPNPHPLAVYRKEYI
ncbi:hypothetical protein HMPREF0604_00788 [Neisseria mucosa C102]|uniref:Transposase n=1 Tax=Neisseria mucosa C102 TaxID=435832 RepID=A0ABP2KIX4_NEIMU|nr:hypothetical protein HMPREF0604_00788 [Neisseria mucosa C102]